MGEGSRARSTHDRRRVPQLLARHDYARSSRDCRRRRGAVCRQKQSTDRGPIPVAPHSVGCALVTSSRGRIMVVEASSNSDCEASADVWSLGHSNHDIDRFTELLVGHEVRVVADVRTSPFSRFSPQFNREALTRSLRQHGIEYVFLGRELGGRPDGARFYDEEGHVRYDRLSASPAFEEGMQRLLSGAATRRVAMVCSEGDPAQCHRHLLIARVLHERGVEVTHILPDGSTTDYQAVAERTPVQRSLFDDEEESLWRSPLSVLHNTPRSPSSDD